MNSLNSFEVQLHIEGRSASRTINYDGPSGTAQFPHTADFTTSSTPLPILRIQQTTISSLQQSTVPAKTMSTIGGSTMLSQPATLRIQQATVFPSQQFTMPAKTIPAIGDPTMASEPAVPAQEHHGLSSESIAGFAMIPVAAILVAAAIFIYFWLQKRRRRTPVIRHLGPTHPPPVPEKDFRSPTSSFDSSASGGKVRSMVIMGTPVVRTGWQASQGVQPQLQTPNSSAVHHNPWSNQLSKLSADITSAGFVGRRAMEDENDSPIDRSSPFRLKRGDTKKRSSLDPEVMSAWPMPPQPAAQPAAGGWAYSERRSISTQYFAQERSSYDARKMQEYWEEIRLELGPDPGPTVKS